MSNLAGFDKVKDIDKKLENSFIEFGNIRSRLYGIGHGHEHIHRPLRCEKDFLYAYNFCSPLKSIIGKRAKSFNSGTVQVVNSNTGKEVKSGVSKDITDVLKKPNPLQTLSQFFLQQNTYIDIFGYCPVLRIRPAGMEDSISSLWNIPPWLFDLEYTKKWLQQNSISGIYQSYFIYWEGERIELKAKDIFIINDDGIGTECDTNLTISDSRLIGHEYEVSNIIACYMSRHTLITKRGAIGILSNRGVDGDSGSVPMKAHEKEELQKDFRRYGLTGQPYQVIVTDAQLEWQAMGYPTKELMLFEEIEDDIFRLCDGYGLPSTLIATSKNTTYENQNQSRKDFIENTIAPESASRMEQFSNGIIAEGSNYKIIRDYSKLPILQEDKKAAADARKTLDDALSIEYLKGLITKNDWREKLGEERLADPEFDKYFDAEADRQAQLEGQIAVATARSSARGNAGNPAAS